MTPSPPEGAPNVLLILVDDAGFGNPSTFGGPCQTPTLTRLAGSRVAVQQVSTSRRSARRHGRRASAGRNHHSSTPWLDRRVRWRLGPGYNATWPANRRERREDPSRQRLHNRRLRQMAPHARQPARAGRAVRPLAQRPGVRLLLGLPRRRQRPVRPRRRREQHDRSACRGGGKARIITSRPTWPIGQSGGCTRSGPKISRSPGSCTTRPGARTRRTRCEGVERAGTGASSTRGWDGLREETFERQKAAGRDPGGRRANAEGPTPCPPGTRSRRTREKLYARQMEVYAGFQENCGLERRAAARRDRRTGRAGEHARHLHLRRQRREHGGDDDRHLQRADDAERHRVDPRSSNSR